ncbi:MAG TPA: hypothetical protein VE912_25000 [Bacteroidales bacterium]|nr:hypothetical protein [Bacteroidales bacterium]
MNLNIHIKIPRTIYNTAKSDLSRNHPYALERVGFLFGKVGKINSVSKLILINDYFPIDDTDYIEDDQVGAKINSEAIHKVMQKILDTNSGALHTHLHNFPGVPSLSKVDKQSIPPLVRSFQHIVPSQIHGIFLFHSNHHKSWIIPPGANNIKLANKITVVGYPLSINIYE